MSIYDTLDRLGISLPPTTTPVAAFVPWIRSGPLLFLSGHIARRNGNPWPGQLGASLTTDEGKVAARAVAIDLMSTLHAATSDLHRIKRVIKVMVLVNSAPTFTEHHRVADGASDLFQEVFGGRHARSAFGVAQTLPSSSRARAQTGTAVTLKWLKPWSPWLRNNPDSWASKAFAAATGLESPCRTGQATRQSETGSCTASTRSPSGAAGASGTRTL